MPKTFVIGQLQYDVYDTHISSAQSRLSTVSSAVNSFVSGYYDGKKYLIFTGPEYVFARKNYTVSKFNTAAFRGTSARELKEGAAQQSAVDVRYGADTTTLMEEKLKVRVKVGYTQSEKDDIISNLSQITGNRQKLLVIPGTILWREYLYFKKMLNRKSKMYNTLPIICNGQLTATYDKKSGSDEIKADYRLREDRLAEKKYHNYQDRRYVFQPGVQSNKFSLWGLKFGVEICADHTNDTLRNDLADGERVDIQVLVSAGMDPEPRRVRLKDHGLMIHNDGDATDTSQSVSRYSTTKVSLQRCPEKARHGALRVWEVTLDA